MRKIKMNKVLGLSLATSIIGGSIIMNQSTSHASEIWGLGDSTSVGWDGTRNVTPFIVTTAQSLNSYTNNWHTQSGSSIQNDMGRMVREFNGDKYHTRAKYIVVNYGVNDANYGSSNLNNVVEEYRARLSDLKAKNPQATITVVLPQGTWLNGNNDTIRQGGYSLNDLRNQQRTIARDMQLNIVEPTTVTDTNHTWTLGDGTVHPNANTYVAIGHKVANTIKSNPLNQSVYTWYTVNRLQTSGYVNTLAGWRWLENGKAYTGMRNYMGAYYYFDKGVRQENKFVYQWGYTYYVGSDGRTVQGKHVINGKTYNFGNDGTFFAR